MFLLFSSFSWNKTLLVVSCHLSSFLKQNFVFLLFLETNSYDSSTCFLVVTFYLLLGTCYLLVVIYSKAQGLLPFVKQKTRTPISSCSSFERQCIVPMAPKKKICEPKQNKAGNKTPSVITVPFFWKHLSFLKKQNLGRFPWIFLFFLFFWIEPQLCLFSIKAQKNNLYWKKRKEKLLENKWCSSEEPLLSKKRNGILLKNSKKRRAVLTNKDTAFLGLNKKRCFLCKKNPDEQKLLFSSSKTRVLKHNWTKTFVLAFWNTSLISFIFWKRCFVLLVL